MDSFLYTVLAAARDVTASSLLVERVLSVTFRQTVATCRCNLAPRRTYCLPPPPKQCAAVAAPKRYSGRQPYMPDGVYAYANMLYFRHRGRIMTVLPTTLRTTTLYCRQ